MFIICRKPTSENLIPPVKKANAVAVHTASVSDAAQFRLKQSGRDSFRSHERIPQLQSR